MTVAPEIEALLWNTYDAFNRKDVDAVLATLHPEVDWPNMIDHVRVVGHAAVRAYWTDQFEMIDPVVQPRAFSEGGDGEIVVDVLQVVRDAQSGDVLSQAMVQHVYTLQDGLVVAMDVRDADGKVISAPRG